MLRRRKYQLFQFLVISIAAMILLLIFHNTTEPNILYHPDMLPYRIELREIQGELVWPIHDVSVGLPISHIRDLGENKSRVLLVIIVSTAPLRRERREAIRQTWWKHCKAEKVNGGERKGCCDAVLRKYLFQVAVLRFAVFRHFRVISKRFAIFLCFSVRCLYVILCGFAVFVPPYALQL